MLTIHILPALYGDTFLIDIQKNEMQANTNILVDCGYNFTSGLLPLLNEYHKEGKAIDRFIITHYDDDHIQSAAKFIKANGPASNPSIIKIKQVWLNSYKHLQFEKRILNQITDDQEKLLKNFIAIHSSNNNSTESEIGAKQASKLGRELVSGNYSWNDDFNNEAVCVEHKSEILVMDSAKIILLGPTKMQLDALENPFKKALKELGIKYSENELIDDAFELFNKSQSKDESEIFTGPISGSSHKVFTPQIIDNIVRNAKYKPDNKVGNGSSISFILEANGKKVLFMADAHAEPVILQLKKLYPNQEKLYFDAIKVGHHGSFNNNPKELYDYIDSPRFIISTDGSHPSHIHPDIETIAFIINRPTNDKINSRKLIFNYPPKHLTGIFDSELMKKLNYIPEVSNILELK